MPNPSVSIQICIQVRRGRISASVTLAFTASRRTVQPMLSARASLCTAVCPTVASWNFQKGCISWWLVWSLAGSSFPLVSFHPQSSGLSGIPFHCWIWKYTLWLERFSDCTKVVPVPTFWQNLVYRSKPRLLSWRLAIVQTEQCFLTHQNNLFLCSS